jgi:Tol biopolymer transport system component
MEVAPGTSIGPYRITERVGQGGMGVVWKAHDTVLDRPVAVKILHVADARASERIVHEARLAARLNNPNVVTIYEARREGHSACIVMEWIAGEPLARKIPAGGLPLHAALGYALPIARALEAAHTAGILHRDLKPSNVMVPDTGEPKLLDFGVAKVLPTHPASGVQRTDTAPTATSSITGTAAYMSPEQVRAQPLDARSDIFSFGALLYELVTGRNPFERADVFSTMSAVLHEEPPAVTHAAGGAMPEAAVNILRRCLRKDPSRRFQTAADLRAALEDLADARRDRTRAALTVPGTRRTAAPVAVGVAIATAAAGLWWLLSRDSGLRLSAVEQVTFDAGIAVTPAFSPDGKLLAFASDRAEAGNLDIWLRHVSGGSAARLTTQPGPEWNPQFSPEGTRLLFLSGDQTIVEIPALAGSNQAPRPVAEDAGPFSIGPTEEIAYVRLPQPTRPGPMFVTTLANGATEAWQPECRTSRRPVWSPEGDRLVFWGECGREPTGFWWAPRRGGTRHRLPAPEPLDVAYFARTFAWLRRGSREGVLFDGAGGPAAGPVWLQFNGEMSVLGERRGETALSAVSQAGDVVLTQHDGDNGVWQLDPGSREPRRLASALGHFGVSRDGRTIVFGRLISGGSGELVVRDLGTGAEQVFASHDSISFSVGSIWPQMSPDGRRVVYRVVGQNGGHYLLDLASGQVKRLASLQEFQLGSDWSADGRRVLGECPQPTFGICDMDIDSGKVTVIVRHSTDQLIYPSWSADGTWVVFGRRKPGGPSTVWSALVEGESRIATEDKWVQLSPPGVDGQRPRLSLDRSTLYYIAGAAGVRRLMSRRLTSTMRPAADSEPVISFPVEVLVVTTGGGPYPLISVTERGLFFSTIARRGNLFLGRIQ